MALVAAGGTAAYYQWGRGDGDSPSGSSSASAELTVRYRNDAPATGPTAKPWLEVINNSKKSVPLTEVTVRYYFSADDSVAFGANCVQTSLRCSHVTQKIGALAGSAPKADHYLQIGFTEGAGALKPGGTTEAIGLQLYRLDHKPLDQSDDRSFAPELTHYAPAKLVTAYLRGALAWGEEPAGAATGRNAAAPGPAAAAPEGVLFDDFHYSGPGDPALASNGWRVRTDGGGPGIRGTWSANNVSFPAVPGGKRDGGAAEGDAAGQALQLRVTSDGTKGGTRQAELQRAEPDFFTGTVAARVYFSDKPTSGRGGDHINESFFTISSIGKAEKQSYSELDYEYMPNGGWGAPGPRLDTTSWRSGKQGDRTTRTQKLSLRGWHTMVITAVNGTVTYSVDGRKLFSHGGTYFPRERMGIHFSAWLVDLPFKGKRTWDMKVDWLYVKAGQAVSGAEAVKAAADYSAAGSSYVNTLPKS
ncbi:cellulose binding domain-containing protein [Streptomyces crystallinus]|uniref:Cellulose binding domain-containing protein n=1 Tax=Streptomyces crystallinus TaxID=68191 RepID=A0ABN1GVV8_9ACTN